MGKERRLRRVYQRELVASVKRKMIDEMQSGVPEEVVLEKYYKGALDTMKREIEKQKETIEAIERAKEAKPDDENVLVKEDGIDK